MKCAACGYGIELVAFVDGPQRVFTVRAGERVHVQCPDFCLSDELPSGEGLGMAVGDLGSAD